MSFTYVGSELELFAGATTWKGYLRHRVAPYLGEDVLEVGAGLGGTTRVLCRGTERRWTCLEPDPALAARLDAAIRSGSLPSCCEARVGTIEQLGEGESFDTAIYIDVLEHIEDDRAEVARAAARLRPGGHLVALSPAHQWLFTPFDAAIGHYRRYSRRQFGALAGAGLRPVRLDYLDSVGLFASLANKLILKSASPTVAQIQFWDRVLVRASKVVDPILGRSAGKSVLAIWRKDAPAATGRD
jgi:SAM-dependent methyltransferase